MKSRETANFFGWNCKIKYFSGFIVEGRRTEFAVALDADEGYVEVAPYLVGHKDYGVHEDRSLGQRAPTD